MRRRERRKKKMLMLKRRLLGTGSTAGGATRPKNCQGEEGRGEEGKELVLLTAILPRDVWNRVSAVEI